MIIGEKLDFAIESSITKAYERLSFRALGFFTIYIGGHRYGVCSPDATMLACSFDEVQRRLADRGNHTAEPCTFQPDASTVADAFCAAIYAPGREEDKFFGIPQPEFSKLFYSNNLVWAPDGDEAFDDGSKVLHFDAGNLVRLIGFKCGDNYHHEPETLSDLWLDSDKFYGVLEQWRDAFESEWTTAPKVPESNDSGEI